MTGHRNSVAYRYVVAFVFLLLGASASAAVTCQSPPDPAPLPTEYWVNLKNADTHVAHISIRLHTSQGKVTLNMPVWNALYQVRNFAANIESVRAEGENGSPVSVVKTSTSSWEVSAAAGCVVVNYDIHLDSEGPFGSQLNREHAFLNWAIVLMYSPELRQQASRVWFAELQPNWKIRDLHLCHERVDAGGTASGGWSNTVCEAASYDELADSPVEISNFQEFSFQQDGATYHIVVHANPDTYDSVRLQENLKQITHAAVDWMQDQPYGEYTFIYHFPRGSGLGGMEHAYGTAIDLSSSPEKVNPGAVADVTAHEFFHLWNVKRIRPQSLEPVDYQHEQDTRALWFSEGVTNTAGDLIRARAGLIDEQRFTAGVAGEITALEQRPAHLWQSAEESSLDAWFEDDAFYRSPERSISYYNKGDVLGVLLDLRIRQVTHGAKSLRDLLQWMNQHFARQHRYFPDSAGVQEAAEAVSGQSFAPFFRDYVAGVKAIPYNEYFEFVGLELRSTNMQVTDPGFATTANIGGQPEVIWVTPGSDAQRAGLLVGDRILEIDGQPAAPRIDSQLSRRHAGESVKVRVANDRGEHKIKIKLASREQQQYVLQDAANVTSEQRAHRTAWVHGDDETGGAH